MLLALFEGRAGGSKSTQLYCQRDRDCLFTTLLKLPKRKTYEKIMATGLDYMN